MPQTVPSVDQLRSDWNTVRGQTVGLIYSYPGAANANRTWYDRWDSKVIADHAVALEAIGLYPLIIDIDTFIEKVSNRRMPNLFAVINLNAGIFPISNWALIPSLCQWYGFPIVPCSADMAIISERKDISYLLAASFKMKVPKPFRPRVDRFPEHGVLFKPRDLGGSYGIQRFNRPDDDIPTNEQGLLEEFIPGFDLTVPLIRDPFELTCHCLDGIMYIPDEPAPNFWLHSRNSKTSGKGYAKRVVPLAQAVKNTLSDFAIAAGIYTYCRIDLRCKTLADPPTSIEDITQLYFLEMNIAPTIRAEINFLIALQDALTTPFISTQTAFTELFDRSAHQFPIDFLLFNTMLCIKYVTLKQHNEIYSHV